MPPLDAHVDVSSRNRGLHLHPYSGFMSSKGSDILGNPSVTHSVPTAECSGYGMGYAAVTEDEALTSLCISLGLPEPSLLDHSINNKISYAVSISF